MGKDTREPDILTLAEDIHALGAGMDSSDASIRRDAPVLGARFQELRRRIPFEALRPRRFVAATSGYRPETGTYHYALGDAVASLEGAPEELEGITIPAGTYAAFIVRPLFGRLWAPAIGKTYAYIYGKWLPRSAWRHDPRGEERRIDHFEFHDERAARKRRPEMEIRVPVAPRA